LLDSLLQEIKIKGKVVCNILQIIVKKSDKNC